MSQRSSDRGLTVGVPCRLNILERHIVARTCTFKRLEKVLRRHAADKRYRCDRALYGCDGP